MSQTQNLPSNPPQPQPKPLASPIPQPDNPLAFPVYVYEEGKSLPETGTYYVLAGNGLWLHKDSGTVYATVRAEGIGHLDTLKPMVGWRLPPIPVTLMLRAVLFLRMAFRKHNAESALLIFWSPTIKEFALVCPSQEVSYGGIKYDADQKIEGYLLVGSIHSHCDFNAYHSPTDRNDEAHFDGLHLTVGHLTERNFSLACSVVVNNHRAQVDPTTHLEGIVLAEAPPKWNWWGEEREMPSGRYRFSLQKSKEELQQIFTDDSTFVEKEWMPQVRGRSFFRDYGRVDRTGNSAATPPSRSALYHSGSREIEPDSISEIYEQRGQSLPPAVASEVPTIETSNKPVEKDS